MHDLTFMTPSNPGIVFTFAFRAIRLLSSLSPIAFNAYGDGPIKVIPSFSFR